MAAVEGGPATVQDDAKATAGNNGGEAVEVVDDREETLIRDWRKLLGRRWTPPVATALEMLEGESDDLDPGPYVCTECGAANYEWWPCCLEGHVISLIDAHGVAPTALKIFGEEKVQTFLETHLTDAIVRQLFKRANTTKRLNGVLPKSEDKVPSLQSLAQVVLYRQVENKEDSEEATVIGSTKITCEELAVMDESLKFLRQLSSRQEVRDYNFSEKRRPLVSLLTMALGVFETIISFAEVKMITALEATCAKLRDVLTKLAPAIWKRDGVAKFRSLALVVPNLAADFTDFKGLYKRYFQEYSIDDDLDPGAELRKWATTTLVDVCNYIFIAEIHGAKDDDNAGVFSFEMTCTNMQACTLVTPDFGPTVISKLTSYDDNPACLKLVCFHSPTGKSATLYRSSNLEEPMDMADVYEIKEIPIRPTFHLFNVNGTTPTAAEIGRYQEIHSYLGVPQIEASVMYSDFDPFQESFARGNLRFAFTTYQEGAFDECPMSMLALLFMLEHQVTFH